MSVQTNTYVLWGVKLDFKMARREEAHSAILEEYQDSPFDQETNPKNHLTCLVDGMCGKYVAIGHVVAKSDLHQGFDEPIVLDEPPTEYSENIANLLVELGLDAADHRPTWIVITHYR